MDIMEVLKNASRHNNDYEDEMQSACRRDAFVITGSPLGKESQKIGGKMFKIAEASAALFLLFGWLLVWTVTP